jgi:hypothetical protein
MPDLNDHEPTSPTPALHQLEQQDRSGTGRRLRSVLIIGAGMSFVLLVGMTLLDRALKTSEAPAGIISFELAGTLAGAEKIMGSWDGPARIQAGISLGLDFFFLMTYACMLAAACRMLAARLAFHRAQLGMLGSLLAAGAWCAACLDAVENMALIQLLIARGEDWHAVVAALCAWLKFGLVFGALAYICLGTMLVLWGRVAAS